MSSINPDLIAEIGNFVNCPRTYFALRDSCRWLREHMAPVCPVSVEGFKEAMSSKSSGVPWLPAGFFEVSDDSLMIIRGKEPLGQVVAMLESEYGRPTLRRHLPYLVDSATAADLSTLGEEDLKLLLTQALSGERLGWLDKLVTACKKLGHSSMLADIPVGDEQALRTTLSALAPLGPETSSALLVHFALNGKSTLFDFLCDLSSPDLATVSGLVLAASWGGSAGILKRLRQAGVDIPGFPLALVAAVESGSLDACEYLLSLGISPNGLVSRDFRTLKELSPRVTEERKLGRFRSGLFVYISELQISPLHALALKPFAESDCDIARLLVSRKADLGAKSNFGLTPLQTAAYFGRVDVGETLLDNTPECRFSDLIFPAKDEILFNPALVDVVLKRGQDINIPQPNDWYGLAVNVAAGRGNLGALKCLVGMGAELDVCGGLSGHTPLTAALMAGRGPLYRQPADYIGVITFLLDNFPGLITKPMACGTCPLVVAQSFVHWAPGLGRLSIRRFLTERGLTADNQRCASDWLARCYGGAFQEAYRFSSQWRDRHQWADCPVSKLTNQLLTQWLRQGLDVNAIWNGKRCLDHLLAFRMGERDIDLVKLLVGVGAKMTQQNAAECLRQFECMRLIRDPLLAQIEDIDVRTVPGGSQRTLLMAAAEYGDLDSVKAFLARGADCNARCAQGRSPLWFAMEGENQWKLVAELLVESGADINARDYSGRSLVMATVIRGLRDPFRWILSKGADATVSDHFGIRPVDVAIFAAQFTEDIMDDRLSDEITFAGIGSSPAETLRVRSERNRLLIYWTLKAMTTTRCSVPESALAFVREYGFAKIEMILRSASAPADYPIFESRDTFPTIFGHAVISAAHKQLLGVLETYVDDGAPLMVTGGVQGHTPLTACIAGLDVRGVEGFASRIQVASFLLARAPILATTRTSFGEHPLFFVRTHPELPESEIDQLEALLAQHGSDVDEPFLCRGDYLARWAVDPESCGYSKFHRFENLTEQRLVFLLQHGARIDHTYQGRTAAQALEDHELYEMVALLNAHGAQHKPRKVKSRKAHRI